MIFGSGSSPGEGNGNPLQYSCLKSHGQRSLVGHSPQGRKELYTTEQLNMHTRDTTKSTLIKNGQSGDFPGDPVPKAPSFHCSGQGSNSKSGNKDPTCCAMQPKKKKEWSVSIRKALVFHYGYLSLRLRIC